MSRPIQADEIRQRIQEFRRLCTADDPESDLNLLLDDLARGGDPIVAAVVEEIDGVVIGWAVCERFRRRMVLNVYVREDYRRRGHATKLVTEVLRTTTERAPGAQPLVGPEPTTFWGQFPNVSAMDA